MANYVFPMAPTRGTRRRRLSQPARRLHWERRLCVRGMDRCCVMPPASFCTLQERCRPEMESNMHIAHVHVHVKPEAVEAFKQVTLDNASNSVKEAGVARFDVIQQTDDLTRFVLVEVY